MYYSSTEIVTFHFSQKVSDKIVLKSHVVSVLHLLVWSMSTTRTSLPFPEAGPLCAEICPFFLRRSEALGRIYLLFD